MRRCSATALLPIPLLAALSCGDPGAASNEPARHLLLISIDTLRADRLSCYDGRAGVSPNIDRLAGQGALFETCYAPMGMTLACVTSMLTSRYPDETGVTYNQLQASPGVVTLAERLADRGFRNRALVANGVLSAKHSGLAQGYRDPDQDYRRIDDEERLTAEAERILRHGFGEDRREFLWLHYMAPHGPYTPPDDDLAALDPDYDGPLDGTGDTLDPIFVDQVELDPRDLQHVLARYDGEVRFVDRLVGRVLAALEDSGQADDTLVVLTADHGEELYDRRYYFYHANSLYGSVTRVPLLFRLPGRIEPGVIDGITELVDLLPTVLDYLDVPVPDEDPRTRPTGDSLRRAIDGDRVEKEFAFAQVVDQIYLVRNKRWSYVRNPNRYEPKSVPEEGRYEVAERELYDLTTDPGERINVADQHPDVVDEMERRLDAWQYGLTRMRPKTAPQLDPERLEELRRLGYLNPEPWPPAPRKDRTSEDEGDE